MKYFYFFLYCDIDHVDQWQESLNNQKLKIMAENIIPMYSLILFTAACVHKHSKFIHTDE